MIFFSISFDNSAGYDGGLNQIFHLEVYKSGTAKLIKKLNSTKPIFEVDGLPRSTTLVLILYSANIKGKSDTTVCVFIKNKNIFN